MEHLEHFGLSQDPFQNNPQLAFYFASPQHTDAERRLLRGVRQGKGLSVIVGPSGTGKTTLISHLLEGLDETAFEASLIVMVHTGVDSKWLLACIARQLGVAEPAATRVALVGQIYQRLVEIRESGRRPVILIDEAQMLTRKETQTELRGLLNLEYDEERLLSLVLSGLPELEDVLALDPPLAERVDIRVELACLDDRNAAAYLAHRMRTAGGRPEVLHAEAVTRIAALSDGIPRRLNTLADNALFEAYLASRSQVFVEDVDRAAQDLAWAREASAALAPDLDLEPLSAPEPPPVWSSPSAALPAAPPTSPAPVFSSPAPEPPGREPAPEPPPAAPMARPQPAPEPPIPVVVAPAPAVLPVPAEPEAPAAAEPEPVESAPSFEPEPGFASELEATHLVAAVGDTMDDMEMEEFTSVAAEVEAVLGPEPDLEPMDAPAPVDDETHGARTAVLPDGAPLAAPQKEATPGPRSHDFSEDSLDNLFVNLVEQD